MAKERPERKPEPEQPATTRVLPMQLQIGDRLPDEAGEWEVIGRPYTSNAGKIAHARVQRIDQPASWEVRSWDAFKHISAGRATTEEGKR